MEGKKTRVIGWFAILLCIGFGIFIGACSIFEYQPVVMTPPSIPGATYVGWETCATCHEAEHKYFKLSNHADVSIDITSEEAEQGQVEACETCHGPGSLHIEDPTNKNWIIRANAEKACFKCHLGVKGQFALQHHHPVPEGRMFCTDCHDMHGSDVTGLQETKLLGRWEKCFKCHPDIRGPFVFEHEALREGCSVCHTVHGSINDKFLVAGGSITCLRCHFQPEFNTAAGTLGSSNHDHRAIGRLGSDCIDCHSRVHGSNNSRSSLRY